MTTWLTDQPESTKRFLPAECEWSPVDAELDDAQNRRLMQWFNPDRAYWKVRDASRENIARDQRPFVLIDHTNASQFDTALQALNQKERLPDGLVCIALTGSNFRGQRHRPWTALRGNLHLTAHYELGLPARDIQAALTMIPAIVSADAIATVSEGRIKPGIKWVNDILVDGRKVSGVLTATQLSGDRVDRVVFGIGINIEAEPEITPTPFVPAAGSLAGFDSKLYGSLPAMFHTVTARLDQAVADLRAGNTEALFEQYRDRVAFIGADVRIWPEGTDDWQATTPVHRGRVAALNPDLSLVMADTGQVVRSGRMAFETSCRLMALRS